MQGFYILTPYLIEPIPVHASVHYDLSNRWAKNNFLFLYYFLKDGTCQSWKKKKPRPAKKRFVTGNTLKYSHNSLEINM